MVVESRVGKYGAAKPAHSCFRFKRTILLTMNEEMAEELFGLLEHNEDLVEAEGGRVAQHLFTLANHLQEALDQEPPAIGEKPAVLAPGRVSRPARKAS